MALIRLYEELNDYLTAEKRKQDICIPIQEGCTVRSILSSLDVVCHDSGIRNDLIQRAEKEKRIILTLDRKILKKRTVIRAIALNTRKTEFQVKEIRRHLHL